MEKNEVIGISDLVKAKDEIIAAIKDGNQKVDMQRQEDVWLTEKEIMGRLKVKSPTTLKKYLTPKKFGRKNLYCYADAIKLLNGV